MSSTSGTKKRPGQRGDFGRETPPPTGTTANIHMWFAAWHMDHGHTVAETDQFVDTLRKLKWTASDLRELSLDKLIEDLHTCGYECEWAPRLAGDLQRSIALKDSNTPPGPKTPFHDLPDLIIPSNRHFIDNTPHGTANSTKVRAWLQLWFNHRPNDPDFKQFCMKFEYQCPVSFFEEIEWDGADIVFFTMPHLKKTILAKYLKGAYTRALAADIREGRKEMRADLSASALRGMKRRFDRRAGNPV